MPDLSDEEKEILFKAHKIKERIRAEQLEAGEITLEEAVNADRADRGRDTEAAVRRPVSSPAGEKDDGPYVVEVEFPDTDTAAEHRHAKAPEASDTDGRREAADRRASMPPERPSSAGHRRKKSGFAKFVKFLLILLLILVLLAAGLFAALRIMITKTNYTAYDPSTIRTEGVYTETGVTNILLIGTDARVSNDASRSDAMILVTMNPKRNRILMTSILRDSYVTIPGYGQNRINHAYQMGGAPLLIQTIENNFGVGIDYYVHVDFYNFIDLIDAVGGVWIDVQPEEVNYVIGYVSELNHIEGLPEGYSFIEGAGYQLLNGRQALGYSRIRYVGTDFARTGRQRTVLEGVISQVKKNPLKVFNALNSVLGDLDTNIDDNSMSLLILKALPMLAFSSVQEFQVPVDGYWSNALTPEGQEVLAIDFANNNARLKAAMYDR